VVKLLDYQSQMLSGRATTGSPFVVTLAGAGLDVFRVGGRNTASFGGVTEMRTLCGQATTGFPPAVIKAGAKSLECWDNHFFLMLNSCDNHPNGYTAIQRI
jgi:hypothetical protein